MSCGCNGQIGNCAGRLDWCLHPGTAFTGTYERRDETTGLPVNWPIGVIGKLVFNWGTGNDLEYPVLFVGSLLSIDLTMAQTAQIPRGACVELWLDYSGTGTAWHAFLIGKPIGSGCC